VDFIDSLVQGRLALVRGPLPHEQASSAPPMRVSNDEASSGATVAQPGPVLMAAPTPSAAAMAAARKHPEARAHLAELLAGEDFLRY
jgi:hypothetical protein